MALDGKNILETAPPPGATSSADFKDHKPKPAGRMAATVAVVASLAALVAIAIPIASRMSAQDHDLAADGDLSLTNPAYPTEVRKAKVGEALAAQKAKAAETASDQ